jgi:hypothetical protein
MMSARAATFLGSLVVLAVLSGLGCRAGGDPVVASSGPEGGPTSAEAADPTTQVGPDSVVLVPLGFSGGETLEGVYFVSLSECLTAGRMTFLDQKIRLTRQEWNTSWAVVEGRLEDATPVQIKGEDFGRLRSTLRTKVFFTVGTRRSEYNQARVRALKEGFEARLLIAASRL